MSIEAMKQALEALDTAYINDASNGDEYYLSAIEALRKAIEDAEKPKYEQWLYVNQYKNSQPWISNEMTNDTIGKIRMEDI